MENKKMKYFLSKYNYTNSIKQLMTSLLGFLLIFSFLSLHLSHASEWAEKNYCSKYEAEFIETVTDADLTDSAERQNLSNKTFKTENLSQAEILLNKRNFEKSREQVNEIPKKLRYKILLKSFLLTQFSTDI